MIKEYKNIGKVEFVKSNKAKRIRISIRPLKGIRLTVPKNVSIKDAEKFLIEKENWIIKNLKKVQKVEDKKTIFTENTDFKTKNHVLKISKSYLLDRQVSININKTQTIVKYPQKNNIKEEWIQNSIIKAITETYRMEAKQYLPKRITELAEKHNFKFSKVSVRIAKGRWGSCSGIDNISLNVFLMMLPDELIDYVILHELCHTIEKNHSHRFWKLLEKVSPNSPTLKKEIKNYSPSVF